MHGACSATTSSSSWPEDESLGVASEDVRRRIRKRRKPPRIGPRSGPHMRLRSKPDLIPLVIAACWFLAAYGARRLGKVAKLEENVARSNGSARPGRLYRECTP